MSNFMVGCISHLPDSLTRCDERCAIHAQQLRWLEGLTAKFPFYQVEGCWEEKANTLCKTTLEVNHIQVGANPPGKNRNVLLDIFYDSDYDWLVCLDDDRRYYPMYNADSIFNDLSSPAFTRLAKTGYLMLSTDPMLAPFKKVNYAWEHHETHWYITKGNPNGFMQMCFIPNLVKYGYRPIYFNGETTCTLNQAPEDVQFQLDWLIAKHPLVINHNLIMDEISQSNGNKSVIFPTLDYRRACERSHAEWEYDYLKSKFPRTPELWKKTNLNKRRNPVFTDLIPRGERYIFKGRDLPKEEK